MRRALVWVCFLPACFSAVPAPKPAAELPAISRGNFPHHVFHGVLEKVVNEAGLVDYKKLRAERAELEQYLAALAKTSPHQDPDSFPTREEALAYWINAHNALVLYAVTERPEMRSTRDEEKSFFFFTKYRLGDEKWTLHSLANDIILGELDEPRAHFALNYAAVGCPELLPAAFFPERVEEQLAWVAKAFCADPQRVRAEGNTVLLSQVFEWASEDFRAGGGPVAYCRRLGRSDLPEKAEIKFLPFDWALNAQ